MACVNLRLSNCQMRYCMLFSARLTIIWLCPKTDCFKRLPHARLRSADRGYVTVPWTSTSQYWPATHATPIRSRFGTAIGSPVLIDSRPQCQVRGTSFSHKLKNSVISGMEFKPGIATWLLERAYTLVRPGFELSVTISNISAVVYIQLTIKRKIVLYGRKPWKQL